ncbi:MAG: hypothetical protein QXI54_09645 [Archaeoglobaceae archaeon]
MPVTGPKCNPRFIEVVTKENSKDIATPATFIKPNIDESRAMRTCEAQSIIENAKSPKESAGINTANGITAMLSINMGIVSSRIIIVIALFPK